MSLKQRLILFLLLPVAIMLTVTGYLVFVLAKETMMEEWKESSILKLQRAAHHIDMRLDKPVEWIEMFHKVGGQSMDPAFQDLILTHLRSVEGVTNVDLRWIDRTPEPSPTNQPVDSRKTTHFHGASDAQVAPPLFDAPSGAETVTLVSDLKDDSAQLIGKLSVTLRFEYLMQDIIKLGWWQSEMVCLVDRSGKYLAHTGSWMKHRHVLGETRDLLELKVLDSMRENSYGTVFGAGQTPDMVSGFYTLSKVPWVIILFAPGEKILAPILKFRLYYVLAGVFCVVVILSMIQLLGGGLTASIRELSLAAKRVEKGDYGSPLPINRSDEVGRLVESFNNMVEGLRERDFISSTFGRYVDKEIAEELLKRPEASRLGGEKRKVAILFSDLRNFTPLSESLTPEQTIKILNRYFSRMIEVVQRHKGIIVDFLGDALLVFFEPLESDVALSANRAFQCASEMQKDLSQHNRENRDLGLPELQMGIGLHVGEVVVGNIGSTARAKYGIVGAAVNLAHRIQSVASEGEIVLSKSAYDLLKEKVSAQVQPSVDLKGIPEPIPLYVVKPIEPCSLSIHRQSAERDASPP
jgi:class 3 adenylate cyclase